MASLQQQQDHHCSKRLRLLLLHQLCRLCRRRFSVSALLLLLAFLLFVLPRPPPPSVPCMPAVSSAWYGYLPSLSSPWNALSFSAPSHSPPLRIALFVKRWPDRSLSGGLERHAFTLHRALADRGHDVHVFTVSNNSSDAREFEDRRLYLHFTPPNGAGKLDVASVWERFLRENETQPFDIVHTESVALPHWKARVLNNVVVSWHGIAYETIYSDIVRDLTRRPDEPRTSELQAALSQRVLRVVEEIKFFPSYKHHVATSDYVGDVLRTIYQIPLESVHIIANGVDEDNFRYDPAKGAAFMAHFGVPKNARLVLGVAGRLVKDKGHPLLFKAFSEIIKEYADVYLMVAGNGPWVSRYQELAPNVKVVGPLVSRQLPDFYNALDVFVNPTLRSQGLDHTLLEAMLCGVPLLATHFSSITRTVIVNTDLGYTFSPNVPSLVQALRLVIRDGMDEWKRKGEMCLRRASSLFTATKMASAYERLFLCLKNESFCQYPLQTDIGW